MSALSLFLSTSGVMLDVFCFVFTVFLLWHVDVFCRPQQKKKKKLVETTKQRYNVSAEDESRNNQFKDLL